MIASPVLILGARSDIGRALAFAYASRGARVIVAARGDLEDDRRDLEIRSGANVRSMHFDVTDAEPELFFDSMDEVPGTVVMVVGKLVDQNRAIADDTIAADIIETNYAGPARYLLAAARRMTSKPGACIVGISSVAGDRGRGSNFIYGSAKAGLTAFLSGLRNAHARRGLHVLTVKPGFVDTRMTAGMNLPRWLTAEPKEVAEAIVEAHENRRDVIYVKARWRLIMFVIRAIPERIFKRLGL